MPPIPPPSPRNLLTPLLQSLPAAAVSPSPPAALLPLLSPILRQRVQLLSSASQDRWLPLLCYEPSQTAQLCKIANSDKFEPHPVSGEMEVDWDSEVNTRYKRLDEETLQSFIALNEFGIHVKCVYCAGDQEGGGDGWRIGEVRVLNSESRNASDQYDSIGEAEARFKETQQKTSARRAPVNGSSWQYVEEEEEDDAYWAQYDNTPARSPAMKRSPAPDSMQNTAREGAAQSDENEYYAQYATVQPAMDSHDPDEAAQNGEVETTLGGGNVSSSLHQTTHKKDFTREWDDQPILEPAVIQSSGYSPPSLSPPTFNGSEALEHPRPTSSTGSATSVQRLEREAEEIGHTEAGVRQHIARSTRSLFLLARSAGITREEFERVVRSEMDVLCMMDDDE